MKTVKAISLLLVMVLILPLAMSCSQEEPTKTSSPSPTTGIEPTATATFEPTAGATTIYVAVDGDDSGNGTKEMPFASLSAAIDKAVSMPDGSDVVISVKDGTYYVSGTIEIPSHKLSSLSIVGDGKPVFTGGITLTSGDFAPAYGEASKYFSDDAINNIICVNLAEHGVDISSFMQVEPQYRYVFVDGKPIDLARYPNKNARTIILNNATQTDDGYMVTISKTHANRIASWHSYDDVRAFGFLYYGWASSYERVTGLNLDDYTFVMPGDCIFGVGDKKHIYILNAPEELDYENEYYISDDGMLYIYAPNGLGDSTVFIPALNADIINMSGANFVTLNSISVEGSMQTAISGICNDFTMTNCEISKSLNGLCISKCRRWRINYNEVWGCAKHALFPEGSKNEEREWKEGIVSEVCYNHIHDYGFAGNAYTIGACCCGSGMLVSHNEIHGCPMEAMAGGGYYNIYEYNEIYDICQFVSDAGTIHFTNGFQCGGGSVFRYNYIHDLGNATLAAELGVSNVVTNGIYLDDGAAGVSVYGNVVANIVGNGIIVGGGRSNTITGNLIINTSNYIIEYDARGYDGIKYGGWWGENAIGQGLVLKNNPLYSDPEYLETFPWLKGITVYENADEVDFDDPMWSGAPGGATVKDNLYLIKTGSSEDKKYSELSDEEKKFYKDGINETVYRFSDAEPVNIVVVNNEVLDLDTLASISLPDYIDIDFSKIGRNSK